MKRDSLGRIQLDDFTPLNNNIIGRKEKIWLSKNGERYLFKCGASNYEIYAELIAEELAHQCGFETAKYELATYKGKTGVVTPSFLRFGDIIISGDKYLSNAKDIAIQNNINLDFSENNIENIMNAFAFQDPNSDISELMLALMKIFCFDLVIMESDRNKTNWSVIRSRNGIIKLAPIYDCSTMARMNTDIDSLVNNLSNSNQVFNITDSIKFDLKINNQSSDNFFEEFEKLCEMFPNELTIIMDGIKNIDTDMAIKRVEDRINNDLEQKNFEIPYNVKFWLRKSIMTRKIDMQNIYNRKIGKNNIREGV